MWTDVPWSGEMGADRMPFASSWAPLPSSRRFPPDYNAALTIVGDHALLDVNGACTVLTLNYKAAGDLILTPLFYVPNGKEHTLVIIISGASRWPSGMTFCGSGYEANLLLVNLSEAGVQKTVDSELIASCMDNITLHSASVSATSAIFQYLDRNGKKEVSFDSTHPGEGLVRKHALGSDQDN